MSRSYKKHICIKICYGDNRDFYKRRRRQFKNMGRIQLRRLLANYSIEDVNDLWIEPKLPKRNTWIEPTDGHYGMTKEMYKHFCNTHPYSSGYYNKEINYYLKDKHNKY